VLSWKHSGSSGGGTQQLHPSLSGLVAVYE
jgi:hypothetical protein